MHRTTARARRLLDRRLRLSPVGLFFAAAYFLASWSPSLLPRTWYYQGLISGLSAVLGYGIGVAVAWFVRRLSRLIALQVSVRPEAAAWLRVVAYVCGLCAVVGITITNVQSQGRTAAFVHLDPLGPFDWLRSVLLALLILAALLGVFRLLRSLTRRLAEAAGQVLPRAFSGVVAAVVVVTLTAWVTDNVVFRRTMQVFASAAARVDAKPPEGRVPPTSPLISGSPASNEDYRTLGYEGQRYVTAAPTAADIAAATGRPALEPIRVYAGLAGHRTVAETADAVVAELRRTGAFDREVLALITSTGTGWVDDWTAESIEYLSDGDSAIASMQYSYLPSAMAVLTDRQTPAEAGRLLFGKVHAAWSALPADRRPMLVVGGESLGSYGGQAAFDDFDDMMSRTQGGVWVGTPSFAPITRELTGSRTPGSPQIAPVVGDGRHVRFVTAPSEMTKDYFGRPYGAWQYPRFAWVQHPSDPVVWWDPALLMAEPDWLREPPGRDVNPDVTWIPWVTFWQLTTDMAVGHDPPDGYGHRYGPALVHAWGAVLGGTPGQSYEAITAGIQRTVDRAQ